jgi:hypothetical protein
MATEIKRLSSADVEAEARAEIQKEMLENAKKQFKDKFRELETAKRVVGAIEAQLEDLCKQIADGTL